MDEIGNILREARELKGLTLTQVHQTLRISIKYLKALEASEYHQLPSTTHVRGYLGKYARFLGLEPNPLLERYEAMRGQLPVPAGKTAVAAVPNYTLIQPELPESENGTFFESSDLQIGPMPTQSSSDWVGRLIVVALLVAIGLISWRFAPLVLNWGDETAESVVTGTAAQDVLNSLPTATFNTQALTSTITLSDTVGFDSLPTSRPSNSTNSGSAPSPTRSPLPVTLDRIEIEINVTERTWLSVVVDDVIAYEGQAKKGDVFSWTGTDFVTVRTGNAAGVFVNINDVDLGSLGERSAVVEETWQTTQ
ncbi:MAG: helix-turn-helix domain-containing protein [Chloroflexi bacterium]|nr:helix-turn-helix domain-containing protein [Chloroflexota bacterium]